MASEVQHVIEEQIDKMGMYSMVIDECKDHVGHEELSTCFRFVNDEGRYYDLVKLKETDAETILNEGVLPTSKKLSLFATLLALWSRWHICYERMLRRSCC
ncbi:Hypothetical predicted protein [Paramuricea clavata]|uniref:Uncharacterized protein n=1 Tax=Paramuricea clavata TaxID=317549 RepID=A0A6S7KBK3_PARCT|nr:Hypothetical predicted protein [Paramuricea clavata]